MRSSGRHSSSKCQTVVGLMIWRAVKKHRSIDESLNRIEPSKCQVGKGLFLPDPQPPVPWRGAGTLTRPLTAIKVQQVCRLVLRVQDVVVAVFRGAAPLGCAWLCSWGGSVCGGILVGALYCTTAPRHPKNMNAPGRLFC